MQQEHPRLHSNAPCATCGTANAANRKFCAGCGQELWEPCLSCGQSNGAWENFCGVCGGNLKALVQGRVDRFETLLDHARMLGRACEHEVAIDKLRRADGSDHPRLAPYAKQCHELAEELQAEFEQMTASREVRFQQAQQYFAQQQYAEALAELEQVHRRLRSAEMQQLADESLAIVQELPALEQEIRNAVAERRTKDILPKVARYLELRPDNPAMRELSEKLGGMQQRQGEVRRNQLLRSAKEKLAQHEYATAARLVQQIDESVRTAEVEKFFDYCQNRAEEVAWLTDDLRDLALFDEHLLPLAERMLKLRPKDAAVLKIVQRIKALDKQHAEPTSRRPRCLPVRAATQGRPVNVLEGFRQIDDTQIRDLPAFQQNYTSFHVACGLALAGLNKAAVSINLLPAQTKGLLGRATAMLKKRPRTAWGLNLGVHALKAIRLSVSDAAEEQAVALACEHIEYSRPLNAPDASPEMLVREALEKFLANHNVQDGALCVSYPAPKTLSRAISLPPADKKKLAELMKFEVRQQIPFPLESVTWDCQRMNGSADLAEANELALFALKTDEAWQFLYPLEELKLAVDLLQPESVALYNYLAFDQHLDSQAAGHDDEIPPRARVTALLDIGAASSNLLIAGADTLWARNLPLGSQNFNKPLVTEFKLTHEQAEQLKRQPALAAFASKSWRAMEPTMRDFLSEVQRSLASFEHGNRQRKITHMFVAGGGICMHGLLRELRRGMSPV